MDRLPRLQGWLDHLISWGGNGLLLGPIFTSSTHGYDTVDYFQIDPRLGDDDDFDALVGGLPGEGRPVAARRGLQPRGPGLPAGREGTCRRTGIGGRGLGVPALRHRRRDHCRLLRGPRQPRHPQPQLAAGAGLRP